MTEIAITCLGSGSALGEGRLWSSILLDEQILLSLPPTAIPQLYRLGKVPTAIDQIFISHRHADHFFGLPFFLLLYVYSYTRNTPLYIIGPAGMEEATARLCDTAWSDPDIMEKLKQRALLAFVEIEEEGEHQAGDISFEAVRMDHFGMDAYGYRITHKGRKIAFTGDTKACRQLDRLIDGADIVITEFTHAVPTDSLGHLDVEAISRLTARVRRQEGIVLATHLSEDPAPIEGLLFCRDGETYLV